ncbi:MAG: substrate-binding domain-containing protein, partial [Acidobacteriota bacterium]
NLIVQKLDANPSALGIFGFSFLDQNRDKMQGSLVDGIEPSFENIAAQRYPVSRPLFFYVKNAHANVIPGMAEFIKEFTSDRAWGPDGYLADIGLIPMPDSERQRVRQDAVALAKNLD